MKKFKITLLLIILLVTLVATFSSASYTNVTMSVVEEPVCTINIGNNSYVERSVLSKDLANKEITLQLKVVNNEENLKPTGEIMLVIDNSKSMLDKVTESKTREDLVIDSAKTLITKLLEDNTKLKIGVVSFSTSTDVSKEGTLEDAKIISELTNDTDYLLSSVSNIEYNGPRTDLDAGINLAKEYFTNTTDASHKYVIVLSDGVPNVALDFDTYYSDTVVSKTKSTLQSLSNIANNVIVMLTGITDGDTSPSYIADYTGTRRTYNEIINEIFGTTEKPTIGKFYNITDDKIEDTIKSDIYKDLLPISQSITDIKVMDYFTEEIVNNFDFSYVKDPNYGKISPTIDETTNSITWNIPELKSGETAIVQYKLKLKTNYDEKIVDKILNTNSKLDITYTDYSSQIETKTSDITPKLKLTEPKPAILPKAGSTIFFNIIILAVAISIILGFRYNVIRNSTK